MQYDCLSNLCTVCLRVRRHNRCATFDPRTYKSAPLFAIFHLYQMPAPHLNLRDLVSQMISDRPEWRRNALLASCIFDFANILDRNLMIQFYQNTSKCPCYRSHLIHAKTYCGISIRAPVDVSDVLKCQTNHILSVIGSSATRRAASSRRMRELPNVRAFKTTDI